MSHQPVKLTPEQIRRMIIWTAQALAAIRKATKHPGVMQTVVLDISDTKECVIEVLAREQVKLILPIDDD